MDDEEIRGFLQEASFCDIAFVLAGVALIVGDYFACDVLVEGLLDVLPAFYLERKRVEVLGTVFYCAAT